MFVVSNFKVSVRNAFVQKGIVSLSGASGSGSGLLPEPQASLQPSGGGPPQGNGDDLSGASSTCDGESMSSDVVLINSGDEEDEDSPVADVKYFRVCTQNTASALRYADSLA
jgi:hypothetical protein